MNFLSLVVFGVVNWMVYVVLKVVMMSFICMWVLEFVWIGIIVNLVVFGLIEIELFW